MSATHSKETRIGSCLERLVRRYRIIRTTPTHVYVRWQEKRGRSDWATRSRKLTHAQVQQYSYEPPNAGTQQRRDNP